MTTLQIFTLLRRHTRLSFKRSPALEQSVVARVMLYLGAGMMAVYMMIFGIALAVASNETVEPAFILMVLPILLVVDFFLRFMVQHTPAMLLKPYMLVPLPRQKVIDTFIYSTLSTGYNWLWLFMFVPYAYITLSGEASFPEAAAVLVSGMLMVLANSQWYLLVRTLAARSVLWWLLPVVVYGAMMMPVLLEDESFMEQVFDLLLQFGATWWMVVLCLAVLTVLIAINRRMQYTFAYEEIARQEKAPKAMKHVWRFEFLDRFGQTGEYLKLELKSNLRNKAIRSRMNMSLALIVVLSLLITYTDLYDSAIMLNFWCYYCFAVYGMTTLVKVMCPEGNYIDLLMVHHENILRLLRAKYYFHCAILLVPFAIMLPAVFSGKFSWLMMLAYLLMASGPLYAILFQLAVYNKQTLPLENKVTGKNNVESGIQLLFEMAGMFLPAVMVGVLLIFFDEEQAYIILAAVGLVFTLAHPLWLRHIYVRLMTRKYENLEGFHATR